MKEKIIIIGRKGLIGSNLNLSLKRKYFVSNLDFEKFIKKKDTFINRFNYIINCTSNINYIKNKYQKKNDFDLKIANKIKNLDIKMIMLSTRKVYDATYNIKESSSLNPMDSYSKNKVISEKALTKILKKKVLILRISNIVGLNNKKSKKLHKTFIDVFIKNTQKGLIFDNKNEYKDFISIKKFCEILEKLILTNAFGIFNVSVGKKIFLKDIQSWLNFYNKGDLKRLELNKMSKIDSFTLCNKKLMNKIKVKNSVSDLKIFCIKMSKELFKND